MYFIQIQYVMEKKKSATSMMENADDDRVFVFFVQNAIGPWPMHEVVPRAVRAAVRMLIAIWMMVFQVSFFMVIGV